MESLPYAELNLSGTVEVDTAITALHALDLNPVVTELLEELRRTQQTAAATRSDQSGQIHLHFKEHLASVIRADLLMGLELLSVQADSPEQKIAAQALLETIRN